ncbi:MAG: FAD-dependent oxidoreductase [Candidatus Aramenus sulfurataquae]|jgi:NADPH-dependent 2,4-dienoyl-CoA reductase/sulfur reductase-like enzyme|uniref:CoA-disulfide reductase n=2 Tax=Candidatus Aramenus sulfurataquae TaxID=1326980 RepID=A0A0F2LNF2_9CREN|nr:FAD-dependent oxidoreductase [Candidatus Aramenus sulfurataquae]
MKVLVLGGGASGMSSSSRVRRLRPDAEITVIERTKMVSHAPCGIPYFVEGLFNDENLFMTYTPDFFREKRKINVLTNVEVKEVDLSSRIVKANGSKFEFDYLVISLGARPKKVAEGKRVFYVHHPAEAVELRKKLWSLNKVAIVGGGILGVEMTEALVERGVKVMLFHRSGYVLNKMLDEDMGKVITERMAKDVELHLGETFERVEEDGAVVVTDKGKYEVDGTIIAIGVEPNIDLVRGQVKLGRTGAIWTDSHMETNVKGVYAVGDAVETKNIVTGKEFYMPFAPVANKMGYVAGSNIAGKEMEFPGSVGTMITKYKDLFIAKTGILESEAKSIGIKTFSAMIKTKTRARYYPGAKEIYVKLVAEEGTKRILGGQIIGGEEVLGRIDMIAAQVMKGFTVEDMFFTDMGYLPAISEVWDPVIIAVRQLMKD